MKWHELTPSIQQRGLAPLYLVVGEEDYLRDQVMATIKTAALGGQGLEGFNCDLFYGDECTASDILACARDLPAFAERRVVLVKDAEDLPAREVEHLIPYLKGPNDTTTLVILASKLDGRGRFSQTLRDCAVVVECGPLPASQAPGWVRAQAGQLGVRLDEDAVLLLAELAGHSLNLVRRELEKLVAFLPDGAVAGAADVEALRGAQPGASVFDLSAAIGAGDQTRALRIVARNLEGGEVPLRILGSLVWQYRRLWKAHALMERGIPAAELGRGLGIPPFRLREFLGQVRLFSGPQLRRAFELFVETDSALKGGRATAPERLLEKLLLDLCSSKRVTAPSPDQKQAPSVLSPPSSNRKGSRPIKTVRTIRSGRTASR